MHTLRCYHTHRLLLVRWRRLLGGSQTYNNDRDLPSFWYLGRATIEPWSTLGSVSDPRCGL